MKIGVLGGYGFLGKNLVPVLEQNNEVYVTSRRHGINAKNVSDIIHWIEKNKLDCLVNLAANCGGIGLNQTNPANLWHDTNLITTAVLEASRMTGIKKLVMIGTVCSYAKHCPVPFTESDLMCHGFPEETNAGYGVAKLNGLFGCQAYRKQYNLNAIYLILVNLYGMHDNFDPLSSHVVPALIRKIYEAKEKGIDFIEIWGDGSATREFLFASDCADAISLAINNYDGDQPINIGSGQEISILSLATLIKELMDYEGEIVWDKTKPNGQPRRSLDTRIAKSLLGFETKTSLKDGLSETIDWYISEIKRKSIAC